jgi:hypothetical protein
MKGFADFGNIHAENSFPDAQFDLSPLCLPISPQRHMHPILAPIADIMEQSPGESTYEIILIFNRCPGPARIGANPQR